MEVWYYEENWEELKNYGLNIKIKTCFSLSNKDLLINLFGKFLLVCFLFCWQLDFHSQYDSFIEKKEVMTEMTHKLTAPVRILINHEPVISQLKMLVYPVRIVFLLNIFAFKKVVGHFIFVDFFLYF